MEAVPRLPMLCFDLKVSPDRPPTEFGKLKQYIRDFYNEDPESYSTEIRNLESLRAQAVHPVKDLTGCSLLKKYYCQLHFLQSRFPMNKDGAASIAFTWRDTYSSMVCSVLDIKYEMVAVLYNIGALHSHMGASDDRTTPEGLKMACTHFQCAAYAFQHIKDTYPQPSGMDLSPDLMQFMYQLSLAQAQECILEKSMTDNRKATINAKVATQIVDYYNLAHNALVLSASDEGAIVDVVGSKLMKTWKRYVKFKSVYYNCISLLYQGMQSEEQQKMGERVTYYQAALDKVNEAIKLSKGLDNAEAVQESLAFTRDVVEGKRKAAKSENEFIYHEEVPDIDSLPPIKGATLVKGISFNINDPDISGQDLFARLVPMKAHESSSLYSEEKAKLLRKMSNLIDTKDEEVVSFMSCLQLDYVRAHLESNSIPQEVVDRCAALSAKPDAIPNLIAAMDKLNDAYHDVDAMLQEIMELIKTEEIAEKEYQDIMGARAPSIVATDLTREANKYMEAHKKAADSNETLNRAMSQHVENLRVLQQPLSQLQSQLPTLDSLNLGDSEILKEVVMLVDKVEEMRKQRSMLASQLRESICSDDITSLLVTKSNENLDVIFHDELQKHDKYVKLIEQNLSAQENILQALTDAYAKYAPTRKATMELVRQRDLMLSALVSSYDAYEDLLAKSSKGLEFYRKLETNLTKLLQRVKGTCKVQQEEREAILTRNNLKVGSEVAPAPEITGGGGGGGGLKLKDYLQKRKEAQSGMFGGYNSGYRQVDARQNWLPGVRPAPVGSEVTLPQAGSNMKPSEYSAQASFQPVATTSNFQAYSPYQVPYSHSPQPQYPQQGGALHNLQYPNISDHSLPVESTPTAPYRPDSRASNASDQGSGHYSLPMQYPPSVPSPAQDSKLSPAHVPQEAAKIENLSSESNALDNASLNSQQASQNQPYQTQSSQYNTYQYPSTSTAKVPNQYFPAQQANPSVPGASYSGPYGSNTITSPYTNYYTSQIYNGNVPAPTVDKPGERNTPYSTAVSQPISSIYAALSSNQTNPYTPSKMNQVPTTTYTVQAQYNGTSPTVAPPNPIGYSPAPYPASSGSSGGQSVPVTNQSQAQNTITQQGSYTAISNQAPINNATSSSQPNANSTYGVNGYSNTNYREVQGNTAYSAGQAYPQAAYQGQLQGQGTSSTQSYSAPVPSCQASYSPYQAYNYANPSQNYTVNQSPLNYANSAQMRGVGYVTATDSTSANLRSASHSAGVNLGTNNQVAPAVYGSTNQPVATMYGTTSEPATGNYGTTNQPVASSYTGTVQPVPGSYNATVQPVAGSYNPAVQPAAGSYGATSQSAAGSYGVTNQSASGNYGATNLPSAGNYGATNQPSAGNYCATNQPVAGNYGASNQPSTGNYGTNNQPVAGNYGASNQPGSYGTGSYGTPNQGSVATYGTSNPPSATNYVSPNNQSAGYGAGGNISSAPYGTTNQLASSDYSKSPGNYNSNQTVAAANYPSQPTVQNLNQSTNYSSTVQPAVNYGSSNQVMPGSYQQAQYKPSDQSSLGYPSNYNASNAAYSSQYASSYSQMHPNYITSNQALPGAYNPQAVQGQAQPQEVQNKTASDSDSKSYVDLLADLDFTVSDKPLQPSQQQPQITDSLASLNIGSAASVKTTSETSLVNGDIKPQVEEKTEVKSEDKQSVSPSAIRKEEAPVVKPPKDPFSDSDSLTQFLQEVEKFEKFVDGLCAKTLSGPTPLDLKWNELQDLQEKDAHKQNISVARCYPMKNRFSDILPYDNSRVELPSTKDDYINASFAKGLCLNCPNFIMTQSPLPSTFCDFWTMIFEQHVELIVCLLSDSQLNGEIYWPESKTDDLILGQMKITLQSSNVRSFWVERIISVSNSKSSRVVVHLQFTGWPNSWFPESPSTWLALVNEAWTVWRGSRATESCIVVHCDSGVGRSGLFIVTLMSLAELSVNPHLPDVVSLTNSLARFRKNPLRDRDHLKFAYQILLYYSQDLLMKRGILSSKVSFDEKRSKTKSHTRHPSQDFLQSTSHTSCTSDDRRPSDASSTGSTKAADSDPLNQLDPLWSIKRHS